MGLSDRDYMQRPEGDDGERPPKPRIWVLVVAIVLVALFFLSIIGRPVGAWEAQNKANDVVDYLDTYREGAQAGIPEQEYSLGASYRWGVGIERNLSLAAQWIRKAADQGYPIAERTLGEMYEQGEGLTANRDDAMLWYRRAARHGDTLAQTDLARLEAKIHPVPEVPDH